MKEVEIDGPDKTVQIGAALPDKEADALWTRASGLSMIGISK